MLSRQHRIYRTNVSRRFNNRLKIGGKKCPWAWRTYALFWETFPDSTGCVAWRRTRAFMPKKKISDFDTLLQSYFCLEKGSLKVKRKYALRFCVVWWIILSSACAFIIEYNSRKWGITKQLLSGFSGNRSSVGPSDELLPSAFGLWQQVIFRANRSSVALKPSQQLYNVAFGST